MENIVPATELHANCICINAFKCSCGLAHDEDAKGTMQGGIPHSIMQPIPRYNDPGLWAVAYPLAGKHGSHLLHAASHFWLKYKQKLAPGLHPASLKRGVFRDLQGVTLQHACLY